MLIPIDTTALQKMTDVDHIDDDCEEEKELDSKLASA